MQVSPPGQKLISSQLIPSFLVLGLAEDVLHEVFTETGLHEVVL
jgi:hypothetical protein